MKSLSIYQINIFQHLIFIIRFIRNNLPNFFSNIFSFDYNSYGTRSSNLFNLPFKKTKKGQFSLSFRSPNTFNKLHTYISPILDTESFSILKKKLKGLLILIEQIDDFF